MPWTKVLWSVACRVTSKKAITSIGMCERNWGDVREIKSGKRSALPSESEENCTIPFDVPESVHDFKNLDKIIINFKISKTSFP